MTTININEKIRDRIKKMGIKDSTYIEILDNLLSHCEKCDLFWNEKE